MENINNFWLRSNDGTEIYIHAWIEVKEARGIIQIVHGMGEHGARYTEFARYMNQRGYLVFASDHRGHGKTAQGIENIGKIKKTDFVRMKDDEVELSEMLKKKYNLPIYLIGHSFGSLLSQQYMKENSELLEKVVLIGSTSARRWQMIPGMLLTNIVIALKGDEYRSKVIEKLALGDFNKRIKNIRTPYDWLNSNRNEVDKYIADPYCGGQFSVGYYNGLAKALANMYQEKNLRKIKSELPILIIAGEEDPVGEYGRALQWLAKRYKKVELTDVTVYFFPKMRHEILNETNKHSVYQMIYHFIKEGSDIINIDKSK